MRLQSWGATNCGTLLAWLLAALAADFGTGFTTEALLGAPSLLESQIASAFAAFAHQHERLRPRPSASRNLFHAPT